MAVKSAVISSCSRSGACANRFLCLWTVQRWTGTPSQTKAMALSSPGVTFTDGIEVIAKPTGRQPKTAAA
jgi:hypothetical protein